MGRKLLFLLALLYTLLLIGASLFSLKDIPVEKISTSDKVLHGVAYFVLVVVWSFVISKSKNRSFRKMLFLIGSVAFIFGIVIEILQGSLTTYREPDIWDVLANTIGIVLAMGVVTVKKKI
ncbi:MAG TPA: VanZ family protein [Salinimicrobium sp.]|nr:VanZ family protein [Salinimicrobium sp.]